jgi:alkylated DNA repair protein alkB family protein 1
MPPRVLCDAYKKYQRMENSAVDKDLEIVDFGRGLTDVQKQKILPVGTVSSEIIAAAQKAFGLCNQSAEEVRVEVGDVPNACTIYEHKEFNGRRISPVHKEKILMIMPGLKLFPSLLPPECQSILLDRLLHRDLSNPLHTTNIHQDYDIPFPPPAEAEGVPQPSFFGYPQSRRGQVFAPLNPNSNSKPLNTAQFLQKKLRWLTLGTQYNWNTRAYSSSSPTPFPSDIAALVTSLFASSFRPESGVVLLYSPKDYMPVHRDVSEECERGLASFSLGCDGLFIIARDKHPGVDEGNEDREQEMVVIRVRSGDVVQMSRETRWAWHAMPKIMAGTCPPWLEEWPVGNGKPREYETWRGYMRGKRLNISCRQVWED